MSDKITVEIELELSTLDYFVQVAKKYSTTAEGVIQSRLSQQAFEASMSGVDNG